MPSALALLGSEMINAVLNSTPYSIWKILKFRDDVVKHIETTIEKIPLLNTLVEKYVRCSRTLSTGTEEDLTSQNFGSHHQVHLRTACCLPGAGHEPGHRRFDARFRPSHSRS